MIKDTQIINFKIFHVVMMVRGSRRSRRHGVGGRGVTPPIVSITQGSNPQGNEHMIDQE
jgi:hypothetical protein